MTETGKIWNVPHEELSEQLLLAQHREWHRLIAVVDDQLRRGEDNPHAAATFQQHQLCVLEMHRRGFRECSGVRVPAALLDRDSSGRIVPAEGQRPWPSNGGIVRRDRWRLAVIWDGKFKGRTTAEPTEWATIVERYKKYGCQHTADGTNICETCRRYWLDPLTKEWHKI